jgi:hypothetical protein
MLSWQLIQLIELHQEEITNRIIHEVRRRTDLNHLRKLKDVDLRNRGRQILAYLGHWLTAENEDQLARQYEEIGKTRFEESIPLHESVRALVIIKDKMIDFVREQGLRNDSVELYVGLYSYLELYGEEQLEHRVGRFFDDLVVHLVRGYEAAWQHAAA